MLPAKHEPSRHGSRRTLVHANKAVLMQTLTQPHKDIAHGRLGDARLLRGLLDRLILAKALNDPMQPVL